MSERAGQTWRLANFDDQGFVIFTVLRSERRGATETEHEILVLEAENFGVFSNDQGHATFWWESFAMVWETDPLYTRIV